MRHSSRSALLPLALLLACAQSPPLGAPLSAQDSIAVRAVQDAYVSAWLADDTAAVLRTLSPDVVLMPPRSLPLKGDSAIRAYWWPQDGSRTKITSFDLNIDELGGTSAIAFARGTSSLAWTYDKDTLHQSSTVRSTNLTLLQRQADGSWKISHQMWGPPLP